MLADAQASYLRALFVTGLIATTSLTAASAGPASPSQKTSPAQKAQIVENYGKLPLSFEANTGQADKSVKFLSRGSGYELYLTGNEAVLELQDSGVRIQDSGPRAKPFGAMSALPRTKDEGQRTTNSVLRLKVVNANRDAAVTGADELPGKVNYFIGNDPAKWQTSVPTYARVRYTGIYPGIDLVYYGNPSADGQLEYDFVVAPGADPGVIALDVAAGLSRHPSSKSGGVPIRSGQVPPPLQIATDGDLVIKSDGGEIRFHKPVVYQEQFTVDSSQFTVQDEKRNTTDNQKSKTQNRKFLEGRYVLTAANQIHFALGAYDHTRPLVIDPVLEYSTYLGGSGLDTATAIAVDSAGNAYVAGGTTSTNFPVTEGAFQTTSHAAANAGNAFVTKLNPTGTALVYSTYLGGSGGDTANAITVDTAGNAYVAGQTYSTDFPVTPGAFQTMNKAAANGDANAFAAKLNPTGTALVYSTYLGGSGVSAFTPYSGDKGNAIAVDAPGDAYVAGETYSTDFPVTPGAYQTTNNGAAKDDANAFVAKLNPAGTALVYSTYLGGSGDKYSSGSTTLLAVDYSGNAYIAGATSSTDFPVTPGAFQTTNHAANSFNNVFVTKLNPTGSALVYSTFLGGSGGSCCSGDVASGLAVDTSGNVYVTGTAQSTDFPVTTGAFQTTNHSRYGNAFVTMLNPTGTALVYSTYLGGSGGAINLMPTLAMAGGDQASGLAIDSSGNVYATGSTASADFPVTQGAYQTTNHDQCGYVGGCIGGYNAFITELNSTGSALVYSTYLGGSGINPMDFVGVLEFGYGDQAKALALDNSGNVYVTGSAVSYDFPVTAGAFQTTLNSRSGNAFVTKLNVGVTSTAITPTVTVTPASSTITSAQPLTVTVSVSGGSGNPTPTGTVTLASGTYASVATTLSGGSATIDIPAGSLLAEPAGYNSPDLLIAKYVPDTASSSTYNFASGLALVNVVAAPSFTITGTAVTVTAGATAGNTSTITVTPAGGFTGSVTLTAAVTSSPAGAQYPPTLSFGSTSPVSITGTAAGTATLTISTTATNTCVAASLIHRRVPWYPAGGAALACILLFGIPGRRSWRRMLGLLTLLVALTCGVLACGGRNVVNCGPIIPGTTAGTYTVTVTGTSGSTTATGTVTLTVQ
jgi:hypothetical protein